MLCFKIKCIRVMDSWSSPSVPPATEVKGEPSSSSDPDVFTEALPPYTSVTASTAGTDKHDLSTSHLQQLYSR